MSEYLGKYGISEQTGQSPDQTSQKAASDQVWQCPFKVDPFQKGGKNNLTELPSLKSDPVIRRSKVSHTT